VLSLFRDVGKGWLMRPTLPVGALCMYTQFEACGVLHAVAVVGAWLHMHASYASLVRYENRELHTTVAVLANNSWQFTHILQNAGNLPSAKQSTITSGKAQGKSKAEVMAAKHATCSIMARLRAAQSPTPRVQERSPTF